jgi:hypothetical protein
VSLNQAIRGRTSAGVHVLPRPGLLILASERVTLSIARKTVTLVSKAAVSIGFLVAATAYFRVTDIGLELLKLKLCAAALVGVIAPLQIAFFAIR